MEEQPRKYYRLMDDLKQQILSKTIKPGDKLPSENELARAYQVSRHTVRKALSILMRGQIPVREPDHVREAQQERRQDYSRYRTQKDDSGNGAPANDPTKQDTREPRRHEPIVRQEKKVGRNDPCPCGSGKKYKNCHGKGL